MTNESSFGSRIAAIWQALVEHMMLLSKAGEDVPPSEGEGNDQ